MDGQYLNAIKFYLKRLSTPERLSIILDEFVGVE